MRLIAPMLATPGAATRGHRWCLGGGNEVRRLPHPGRGRRRVCAGVVDPQSAVVTSEGAVFKKLSSIYLPGQRTRSWRKVLLRNRISCIVVDWIPGGGRLRNLVGALVLGAYYDDHVLRYVGSVGTGFSMAVRR